MNETTAIVMVHGFMESTTQFDRLEQALSGSGRTCFRVVLPGHGGTIRDFRRSDRHQWTAHVRKVVADLSQQYDHILLIGHSMGCLLSIDAAEAHPNKVSGVVAIALPLYARITWRAIRYRVAMLGRPKPTDDVHIAAVRSYCGVSGITVLNFLSLIPNALELLRLMGEGRKRLHGVKVPLTVVNSDNDEIVARRSAVFVEKRLPTAKVVRLKEASHFHYPHAEQEEIIRCANGFLYTY